MFAFQQIFLALFAAFVVSLLAMSIASHVCYARGRSHKQRTMSASEIDAAVAALAHPDENRRDTRPRRMRYPKPRVVPARGIYVNPIQPLRED